MVDYRIWYDNSLGGDFEILVSNIAALNYIATGLTQGATYKFRVQSRNVYGYSILYSNEVSILAAQIPAVPAAPTTEFVAASDAVVVSWVAPDNGGSPIISYTILIRESDGVTYTTELGDCDGSDSTIVSNVQCTVPALKLHLAPFGLPWASHVYAKIVASNIYGSSEQSEEGNGAIIYAVPDAPVSLSEVLEERSSSTLGLTWEDGPDPGGLPVIDYRVTVVSTTGTYSVVTENLTSRNYVALLLTLGEVYSFTVQSRNSHGYSLYSEPFEILCAIKPGIPTGILTVNNNAQIDVSWTAPSENGSPITAYQIFIKTSIDTFEL